MFKKGIAMSLVLVLIVIVSSGCAGTTKSNNDSGISSTASTVEKSTVANSEKGTVEIFWQQEVTEKFWDYPLKKFKEEYPGVTVNFVTNPKAGEVMKNRMASGDVPDIFYTWTFDFDFYTAIKDGLVNPVDDILKEKTVENDVTLGEKLLQPGLEIGYVDGKHYMLPVGMFLACNYYNGNVFKDNKYSIPKTWNEYISLCENVAKNGKMSPIIFGGSDYPYNMADVLLLPTIYNIDKNAFDKIKKLEPGAWTQPAVLEAVKRLQALRDKGYLSKNSIALDHIQAQMEFINGKAATIPIGTWLEGEMEGQWPDNFDLQPFFTPAEDNGVPSVLSVVIHMILPKKNNSDNLKYDKELIKLFYSNENIEQSAAKSKYLIAVQQQNEKALSYLPKSAQAAWAMLKSTNANIIIPTFEYAYAKFLPEYQNNLNALCSGQIDVNQFCQNMEKKTSEITSK